jgi:hypothetical protein
MYQTSRLTWFMSRDRPLIQAPYGLKVIGYTVVADTYIHVVTGAEPVQGVHGLRVIGIMAHVVMPGIEVTGDNL